MKFITILCVFFYTLISFFIGGLLISFAFNWLNPEDIIVLLGYSQLDYNSKMLISFIGFIIIIIGMFFAQLILGKMEKEKTIAFSTSTGQVTIALSAVEDLIRRLTVNFSKIKEIKPNVIANKRGVEVKLKVILYSDVNIPNLTNQLQELIKLKVSEMLGIEEEITVKVHIAKIISYGEKKKQTSSTPQEETNPPYSGFVRG